MIPYGHTPSPRAQAWAAPYIAAWHRRNAGRRIAEAFTMARGARAQVGER